MMYDLARAESLAAGLARTIREIEAATHIVVLVRDRARGYFYGSLAECKRWAEGMRECDVIVFETDRKHVHIQHARKAWRA